MCALTYPFLMPKPTLQMEGWEDRWVLGCGAPQENTECQYIRIAKCKAETLLNNDRCLRKVIGDPQGKRIASPEYR